VWAESVGEVWDGGGVYAVYTACKTERPATRRRTRLASTRFAHLFAERAPSNRRWTAVHRRLAYMPCMWAKSAYGEFARCPSAPRMQLG